MLGIYDRRQTTPAPFSFFFCRFSFSDDGVLAFYWRRIRRPRRRLHYKFTQLPTLFDGFISYFVAPFDFLCKFPFFY